MQHEHHRVPVTALTFCGDLLLTGIGPELRAYNRDTILLICVSVFESQAIHGIAVQDAVPTMLLVWGGAFARVLRLLEDNDRNVRITTGDLLCTQDWILDAAFCPSQQDESIASAAAVTAHNALLVIEVPIAHSFSPRLGLAHGQKTCGSTKTRVFGSNCILYSAHVSWLSPFQCLVASGTAFGEILLWSYRLDGAAVDPQLHFTFTGHEGSIFGAQISPPLRSEGKAQRLLASCSDDRTIRIWDISDLSPTQAKHGQTSRETGFGVTPDGSTEGRPPCLAQAMGHISRIWNVEFLVSQDQMKQSSPTASAYSTTPRLASFGEDASVVLWDILRKDFDGTESIPSLKQQHAMNNHNGKNIWSTTVDASAQLIATGGADGSIVLQSSGLPGIPREIELASGCDQDPADTCRTYAFLSSREVIVTTNAGCIYRVGTEAGAPWTLIAKLPGLRGYSVVTSVVTNGVVFLAGSDGTVYAFSEECGLVEVAQTTGKTAGLFASETAELAVLVTTVGSGIARMFRWDRTSAAVTELLERPKSHTKVVLPDSFIATSFITASETIVLGSRTGSIALFSSPSDIKDVPLHCKRLMPACAKDAVTSLKWMATPSNSGHLFSTARDGTYRTHKIDLSAFDFTLVNETTLPLGPNIEGLLVQQDLNALLVWGFRSKHFVVYDTVAEREILTVECGGAHRNWAFYPTSMGGDFIWTKASKMYRYSQSKLPSTSINSGGHGREIKSVAVNHTSPQLIATGAEDTDIKISVYGDSSFRCLQTLRKHNTGIQHLQWSERGDYLFSSGGFEEFFVWRMRQSVPVIGVGVICESVSPTSTGGKSDLRIMAFDVASSTANESSNGFYITMAYSDSTMREWKYADKRWYLLTTGDYLTSCLTQVVRIDSHRSVTAATDGHLTLWDSSAKASSSWSSCQKTHQSAVLVIATHHLPDASVLLLTGGDDNALAITRYTSELALSTLLIPRAHAAAVTALAIVPRDNDGFTLVSSGLDQYVKVWDVAVNAEKPGIDGVEVRRRCKVFTPVADVSGMALLKDEGRGTGVLVCGVGMDVWRLANTVSLSQ